jgi:putative nucleotidyltransferase with HDIG domain
MSMRSRRSTVLGVGAPAPDLSPQLTDEEIAGRIRAHVLGQVESDALDLPALPQAAARGLMLLNKPDFSLHEVAAIVETDPLIAARLLRVANSAALGARSPLRSIIECVTRLGASELRLFLVETAARPLFESRDRRIAELGRCVWEHSVAVALLSRMLVQRARPALAEGAYLSGLLHDIGKPILAAMLLEAERRLVGSRTQSWILPGTWLRLIDGSHRSVGLALARKWRLPSEVAAVLQEEGTYDAAAGVSVANAVRLANAIAKREGLCPERPDAGRTGALIAEGMGLFGLDEAAVERLVDALQAQLAERMS